VTLRDKPSNHVPTVLALILQTLLSAVEKRKEPQDVIHEMSYAVQGAIRQEKRFEVLANHMANAATTGFKTQTLSFDRMLQAHMSIDTSQGDLLPTGNPLDLAISGNGYFKIQTDQGIRYTRNGTFLLNDQGTLVTGEGNEVMGENGAITIDGDNLEINGSGEIQVDGAIVEKLSIVDFQMTGLLEKRGDSLFAYNGKEADEIVPEQFQVVQGTLEQSNVETVAEMTRMIETNRFYESFQKLMQTIDELNAKAISDVGQVR
jgi:flagellar basal-body rod protein FlgG